MALHYTVTGAGPLTVVLTHGLAASEAVWAAQVAALAPRYRVLTWDLRGHGRSAPNPGPCAIADLAADLRRVLDAADVARAIVLGHSAGGVVAMRFALEHPERTAGLVLVGTASECNDRARDFYEGLAALAEERGMDPVRRRLGVNAEQARLSPTDPATFARVARAMASLNAAPLTSRLGEIRCPAQMIVGEKDFLGAGGSVILHRHIPGSRLAIVPGRGHGLFAEDPAGFNAIVLEFLATVEGAAQAISSC
jgi:pimeloyl-ACP methyl ester carboxylesterase